MDVRFAANGTNWGRPRTTTEDELVDWRRFLDEVAAASYDGIEFGPPIPSIVNVRMLRNELDQRNLSLAGILVSGPLETPEGRERLKDQVAIAATFISEFGAEYIFVIDAIDSSEDGDPLQLDQSSWNYLIETMHLLNEYSQDLCGVPVLLHPHEFSHVDSLGQIEQFLRDTETVGVPLLFDTGHCAYRGGDPVDYYVQHRDRISQIHLKNLEHSKVTNQAHARIEDLVATGAFADLTVGDIDFEALRDALDEYEYRGWVTIEMLRIPPELDRSLEMACHALSYLRRIHFGS